MKICPCCNYENFKDQDFCERCGHSITNIQPENFNIAGYITQNYRIYAIIGIFVGLFSYLFNSGIEYIGFVPLFIAIYLIFYLIEKSYNVVKFRKWNDNEDNLHFESFFHSFIFIIIHFIFIVALFFYIPDNQKSIFFFFVGIFISLLYFSSDFSISRDKKILWILVISLVIIEISFIFSIFLTIFSQCTNNGFFAFLYWWCMLCLFLVSFGILFSYSIITLAISAYGGKRSLDFTTVFIEDYENKRYMLILTTGTALGIAMGIFLNYLFF